MCEYNSFFNAKYFLALCPYNEFQRDFSHLHFLPTQVWGWIRSGPVVICTVGSKGAEGAAAPPGMELALG